jgi:predicted Rossmann fold nucleotide-binding protein DprA/Smf involved in DNA uptake
MKKLQDQLKSVSKSLVSLSKQVESLSKQVDKFQGKKATVRKKETASVGETAKATAAKGAATVLDSVFDVIKRSRTGASIARLKEKTGLEARQLSNALYKLSKRGKIETKARGLYVKSKK